MSQFFGKLLGVFCMVIIILSGMSSQADADFKVVIGSGNYSKHNDRYAKYDRHDRHVRYNSNKKVIYSSFPHDYYSLYKHPHYLSRARHDIRSLPFSAKKIIVKGYRYYYYDGVYYVKNSYGYEIVSPPIGACVSSLPFNYTKVVINGSKYYYDDGIYYLKISSGYQVVYPPETYYDDYEKITSSRNEFVLNIPTEKGDYTPVIIKRSADGFVGPQGEFYQNFPRVDQLAVMYGHNK